MPRFSEDDVTDFLVVEALVTRATIEQNEAQQDRERQDWMKGHKDWAKEAGLTQNGGR